MPLAMTAHLNQALILWCAFALCARKCCLYRLIVKKVAEDEEKVLKDKSSQCKTATWDERTHVEISAPHKKSAALRYVFGTQLQLKP